MVHDDFFGPWGRIVVTVVAALAIVVALLLVACFLTPGCLGYECIRRRKRDGRGGVAAGRGSSKQNENVKLNDVSYRSWRLGSLYEDSSNGTIHENGCQTEGNTWNSGSVPLGCSDTSSTLNLVQREKDKQRDARKRKEFPTELTVSLQYLPPYDDAVTGKLVIGIEALSGLPPKQYSSALEPYVALNIMKQSWSHRKRQKLHSFRTRSVRHTACPIFKETFVVANVKHHEIKEWILDFAAYDRDRYANDTELCNFRVSLKEARHVLQSPEIHMFNFAMKPSNLEFGNILLAVSYLPTAQRLTVNVMKLRDVKFTAMTSLSNFNVYARVLMLNGRTGQRMKKKKTRSIAASTQPEFNETLTFDVSYSQLDVVQFLVVLCTRPAPVDTVASTFEQQSDSEDSAVTSTRKPRDVYVGKVALGKGVRGSTERLHWFSVLQNPRKLVTVWHVLK